MRRRVPAAQELVIIPLMRLPRKSLLAAAAVGLLALSGWWVVRPYLRAAAMVARASQATGWLGDLSVLAALA